MNTGRVIRYIVYFSFFTVHFSFAQQDSGFTNKSEAKNLKVKGKKEGKWVEYRESLKRPTVDTNAAYYGLTIYKDNKAEGIRRYYNRHGVLLEVISFTNGKKNGITKDYYDSGKLLGTYPYKDGKMEGVVKTYYENGQLNCEWPNKNDKLEGMGKGYYTNGNLEFEGTYSNDKLNGFFKRYDESGKLQSETQYTHDKEVINLNSPAQNGNKILLNKTFKGRVVEDYNTPDSGSWEDKIIFKNNYIYFKVFSKNWGFPYALCTISVDSNTKIITFTSEVKNSVFDYDSRKLSGTINGNSIEGTVVITRSDGVKRPYSFSGKTK